MTTQQQTRPLGFEKLLNRTHHQSVMKISSLASSRAFATSSMYVFPFTYLERFGFQRGKNANINTEMMVVWTRQ